MCLPGTQRQRRQEFKEGTGQTRFGLAAWHLKIGGIGDSVAVHGTPGGEKDLRANNICYWTFSHPMATKVAFVQLIAVEEQYIIATDD
jgi:hypothetical protein